MALSDKVVIAPALLREAPPAPVSRRAFLNGAVTATTLALATTQTVRSWFGPMPAGNASPVPVTVLDDPAQVQPKRPRQSSELVINDPFVAPDAIADEFVAWLDSRPPGSTVVYLALRINDDAIIDAIKRTDARGVRVLVCMDTVSRQLPPTEELRTALRGSEAGSELVYCLVKEGDMHLKAALSSADMSMWIGSTNPTVQARKQMWGTMIHLRGYTEVYAAVLARATALMGGQVAAALPLDEKFGDISLHWYPRPNMTKNTDPRVLLLRAWRDKHKGAPEDMHVRVADLAFLGESGKWYAEELRDLAAKGVRVQVMAGSNPSPEIRQIFAGSKVDYADAFTGSVVNPSSRLIHYKYVGISVVNAQGKRERVYSDGSTNATDKAMRNPDLRFEIENSPHARTMEKTFDYVWKWALHKDRPPQGRFPGLAAALENKASESRAVVAASRSGSAATSRGHR